VCERETPNERLKKKGERTREIKCVRGERGERGERRRARERREKVSV